MKKIVLLVLAVCLLLINPSYAGFLVKKNTTKATAKEMSVRKSETAVNRYHNQVAIMKLHAAGAKNSFLKRAFLKLTHPTDAIHPVLYVVCCVFWLGWLAMGINDDFGDYDWLICLLLYFLFYFPGLIYSLIKMEKYY